VTQAVGVDLAQPSLSGGPRYDAIGAQRGEGCHRSDEHGASTSVRALVERVVHQNLSDVNRQRQPVYSIALP
jgi:hypothetical protein